MRKNQLISLLCYIQMFQLLSKQLDCQWEFTFVFIFTRFPVLLYFSALFNRWPFAICRRKQKKTEKTLPTTRSVELLDCLRTRISQIQFASVCPTKAIAFAVASQSLLFWRSWNRRNSSDFCPNQAHCAAGSDWFLFAS